MPVRPEGRFEQPGPISDESVISNESGSMGGGNIVNRDLYNFPQSQQHEGPLDFPKELVRPLANVRESLLSQRLREHQLGLSLKGNDQLKQRLLKPLQAQRLAVSTMDNRAHDSEGRQVPELRIDEPTYYQKSKELFYPEYMRNEREALSDFKYWSDLFNEKVTRAKNAESKIAEFNEKFDHLRQREDSNASDNGLKREFEKLLYNIEAFKSQLRFMPQVAQRHITLMEADRQKYTGDQVNSMDFSIAKAKKELDTLPNFRQHIEDLTSLHADVSKFTSFPVSTWHDENLNVW